jgi:molecular chaperone DnaK (HSP70)
VLLRLSREIEEAKKALSTSPQVEICLDNFYLDYSFELKITRALLESLTKPLFDRARNLVCQAFEKANLQKVDHVLLTGGTSSFLKV